VTFLRNLFRRRAHEADASATGVLAPPPAAPLQPAAGQADTTAARAREAKRPEDGVCIPLKSITDLFPEELKGALRKQPSEHVQVYIPKELIVPHLAAGAVRITFAELRAVTPEVFFHAEGAAADAKVLLPLATILRQVAPPRRAEQKQPAVPANIPSIFTKTGQASPVRAAAAEGWYTPRRPTYEEAEPEAKAKGIKKAVPAKANGNGKEAAATPVPAATAESERKLRMPEQEKAPAVVAPEPVMSAAVAPEQAVAAPEPPVAAPEKRASVADVPTGMPDCLEVPLAATREGLPAEIREALNGSVPETAVFRIPMGEFETRMRTGRLIFKWNRLREWCDAELAAGVEGLDVELPLATVVPIFLAARKAPVGRKQVEVDARIPDVFGKTEPVAAEIAAPAPVAAQAEPMIAPQAVAAEPEACEAMAPARNEAAASTPAQVVEELRKLEGVSGAFIATADGLLVVGDVRASNENVLAAFAPTVFAQLTKYADMAKLGLPEAIDIHLGGGTSVHICKTGKLYLGVLTPRDTPLPRSELARFSASLQPRAL